MNQEISLRIIEDFTPEELGETPQAFMQYLGRPSVIKIKGQDTTRTRAIVTLLHGNEPSGLRATQAWLKKQITPKTNIIIIIGALEAAMEQPNFTNRYLPGRRDLNRCFRPPFFDETGQLAKAILDCVIEHQPEALIDIHNTSGSSPAFGVAIEDSPLVDAIGSLFVKRIIVTDIRLGALMEAIEGKIPSLAIECGGTLDNDADSVAYEGIERFTTLDDVFAPIQNDWQLEKLCHPIRVELKPNAILAYGASKNENADITLHEKVERFNFGVIAPSEMLGWLGKNGLSCLQANSRKGDSLVYDFFDEREGVLYPKRALRLFMVTTNRKIAKKDCLFYVVAN